MARPQNQQQTNNLETELENLKKEISEIKNVQIKILEALEYAEKEQDLEIMESGVYHGIKF